MTLTEFLDKIDEITKAATQTRYFYSVAGLNDAKALVWASDKPDGVAHFSFFLDDYNPANAAHIARMDPPTTLALTAALRKCVEALELISGPSEWNCEIGEANQRAAAKIVLSSLSESFREMK